MKYRMYSGYGSFTIRIDIITDKPQSIVLKVYNEGMANTLFTDRYMVINGKQSLYVRMPVSGSVSVIEVYNEANGNVEKDSTFKIADIRKIPLVRKLDVTDFNDPELKSYIKFCTRFCFNAGIAPPGTYNSLDGRYSIVYSAKITNDQGTQIGTPARINKDTGQIEVAQDKFIDMTVPMRMAILLHEFSHYHINSDINDEVEADLNALLIYLGLGYPRIEACEAFLDTFIKSSQGPNPLTEQQKAFNSHRYNVILNYIRNFEKNNFLIKE